MAKRFSQWLVSKQHKNITVMAYNARAYDTYFVYNYLINNSFKPQIIFKVSKIMYCKIDNRLNIRMLDFLNFLPMVLSQLPKSFGLKELKKGYFPHLYKTPEHEQDFDKVFCNLPDIHFYDANNMRDCARAKLMEWYQKNKNKSFDFHTELLSYCRSDVNVLLNTCWNIQSLEMHVMGLTNPINPVNYTTIASVCMDIFCSKFLTEECRVLLHADAKTSCQHEWLCSYKWCKAIKHHGNSH